MEVRRSLKKLAAEQMRMAGKIALKDGFKKLELVGGADCAFTSGRIASAVVVCRLETMEVVEEKTVIVKEAFPYIPGFLFYREGPAIIRAFKKLETKPDVLLVNACGVNHPRGIGMASHIGLKLGIPCIGVSQNSLGFREKELTVGKVFVAPGHMVSMESAAEVVKRCMKGHRLPEPLFLAHVKADEKRKEIERLMLRRRSRAIRSSSLPPA
jgi:deoxyribonuclease V